MVIPEDADGDIDLADLREQLIRFAGRPVRIGSFSAASNVTGILTDTSAVASLLHAHGALSSWYYAAAGPYVPVCVTASAPPARATTRTRYSSHRTSSPAVRRRRASWSSTATSSATPYLRCPAAAQSRSWTLPAGRGDGLPAPPRRQVKTSYPGYLREARALLDARPAAVSDGPTGLGPDFEALR